MIRATGALDSALDAMKATRDFACVHAFYQRRQAAEIAHAAACKLQVMYTSVLDRKLDITRTCAVRCVCREIQKIVN